MGRGLRSQLDLIRPDTEAKVIREQERQKAHHDKGARSRPFAASDTVLARNYSGEPKWLPGVVLEETGPVSGRIELEDGAVLRRHHDQLHPRKETQQQQQPEIAECVQQDIPMAIPPSSELLPGQGASAVPAERRYPTRERRPPDRYQ